MSAPPPPPGQYPPPPPYQPYPYSQPQYPPAAPPYVQPPYAPAPYQPPPPPQPKDHTLLIVVIVVVVVAVIIVVAAIALGLFAAHVVSSLEPSTQTIVASGTIWNLKAGQYEDVGPVSLGSSSGSWEVYGTFSASNGSTAYVMTSGQFSDWGGAGSPASYEWTSGVVITYGTIDTLLNSGTYYFVWLNTNSTASTTVDITSNVDATTA